MMLHRRLSDRPDWAACPEAAKVGELNFVPGLLTAKEVAAANRLSERERRS